MLLPLLPDNNDGRRKMADGTMADLVGPTYFGGQKTGGLMEPDEQPDPLDPTIKIVARRQKYFRRPKSAGKLTAEILTRYAVAGRNANAEMKESWEQAVGATLARYSQAIKKRGKVLEVLVANSSTMSKLQFQKRKIVRQLKNIEAFQTIEDLKFRIGQVGN